MHIWRTRKSCPVEIPYSLCDNKALSLTNNGPVSIKLAHIHYTDIYVHLHKPGYLSCSMSQTYHLLWTRIFFLSKMVLCQFTAALILPESYKSICITFHKLNIHVHAIHSHCCICQNTQRNFSSLYCLNSFQSQLTSIHYLSMNGTMHNPLLIISLKGHFLWPDVSRDRVARTPGSPAAAHLALIIVHGLVQRERL